MSQCNSRLNNREWIETEIGLGSLNVSPRNSRLNNREWIETPSINSLEDMLSVTPGLITGSGLKRHT
ncbi:protein of unknown function [Methylocaldum szegediense]|uniref:Uncharacterized protein n=1 Tax=Methylocaldum szegediense TaxID=73780 RepID=A0ABM9I942_9GAMM|nr:protein of unknown function [Methylocaldum szegediense]